MNTERQKLFYVEIRAPGTAADMLEEVLASAAVSGAVQLENPDALVPARSASACAWFSTPEEAEEAHSRLKRTVETFAEFAPELRRCEVRTGILPARAWTEEWKKWFRPVEISPRLVVKPTWASWTPRPGQAVLELDPGMCFGTGRHPSTQGALRAMDALCVRFGPGLSFLDAGCGSGILSLAAVLMGYRPVTAFDADPDAARITRENAMRTGSPVQVFVGNVATFRPARPFRVVAANILAPVLIRAAETLSACVDRNAESALILSGMLTEEVPRVQAAYAAHGLHLRTSPVVIGNWAALVLQP